MKRERERERERGGGGEKSDSKEEGHATQSIQSTRRGSIEFSSVRPEETPKSPKGNGGEKKEEERKRRVFSCRFLLRARRSAAKETKKKLTIKRLLHLRLLLLSSSALLRLVHHLLHILLLLLLLFVSFLLRPVPGSSPRPTRANGAPISNWKRRTVDRPRQRRHPFFFPRCRPPSNSKRTRDQPPQQQQQQQQQQNTHTDPQTLTRTHATTHTRTRGNEKPNESPPKKTQKKTGRRHDEEEANADSKRREIKKKQPNENGFGRMKFRLRDAESLHRDDGEPRDGTRTKIAGAKQTKKKNASFIHSIQSASPIFFFFIFSSPYLENEKTASGC